MTSLSSAASGRISVPGFKSEMGVRQPLPQRFQLAPQGLREAVAELLEEAGDAVGLLVPIAAVDGEELVRGCSRSDVQAGQVEAFGRGHVADGRAHGVGLAAAAVEDPLDHAEVLAVARPEEAGRPRRCGTS